jgi:hypothetical protein
MRMRPIILTACIVVFSGCYHATVTTGLTPSTEVIHETFASSWVYGLVPPNAISAELKCKHGVATVETQLSFLNQVVGIITIGIYTPMDIKVTCAAAGAMGEAVRPDLVLPEDATPGEFQMAFAKAADLAVSSGRAVHVRY